MTRPSAASTLTAPADTAGQIKTVEEKIENLREEKERLPQVIVAASKRADTDAVVRLRRRVFDIDSEISALEVQRAALTVKDLEQRYKAADEAGAVKQREAKGRADRLMQELEESRARSRELEIEFNRANSEYHTAHNDANAIKLKLEEARKALSLRLQALAAKGES